LHDALPISGRWRPTVAGQPQCDGDCEPRGSPFDITPTAHTARASYPNACAEPRAFPAVRRTCRLHNTCTRARAAAVGDPGPSPPGARCPGNPLYWANAT